MHFTIKLKLALAFAFIIAMSGGMATMAILNLSALNSAITEIVQGPAKNLQDLTALTEGVSSSIRAEKNAILNTDPQKISGYPENLRFSNSQPAIGKRSIRSAARLKAKSQSSKNRITPLSAKA